MQIHPSVTIHPSAILEGDIEIGEGTRIGAYTHLMGPLRIGRQNSIGSFCVLGAPPGHRSATADSEVRIGDRNQIREFTTIETGILGEATVIGDDCLILSHVTVSHCSRIGDGATLSSGVKLAGCVTLQKSANLGLSVVVHQYCVIGAYSMVGMAAVVTKNVPPFLVAYGSPCRAVGLNSHVFGKLGLSELDFPQGIQLEASPHPQVRHALGEFLLAAQSSTRDTLPSNLRAGVSPREVLLLKMRAWLPWRRIQPVPQGFDTAE